MGTGGTATGSGTPARRLSTVLYVGVGIGLVAMFALGTAMSLVGGQSFVEAAGIGAFAGIWGGPGFGGMAGAIYYFSCVEPFDQADAPAPGAV
jgi:hypothetical protein